MKAVNSGRGLRRGTRSNENELGEKEKRGDSQARGKIAHELDAIFNSRIPSVRRGQGGSCLPSRSGSAARGGKGLKGKDERGDGDGCTLRVADRTEISARDGRRTRERGRERERASFPLAACIIQKLAGLYTPVFCCMSKQIEMQTAAE